MLTAWRSLRRRLSGPAYGRKSPLVLINGLAEQSESWFCNADRWRRDFEVHLPRYLVYEGEALHRRIEAGGPIDVDYLVEQLRRYLDEFVQTPPYHLVANSLGGKIAVEFAARWPERVARMVLLCPSGLADEERLPVIEGVRRGDVGALVHSIFSDARDVDPAVLTYYQGRFADRRWRSGLLRTIRGTMDHRVRDRIPQVTAPTLLVVGAEDRIVPPADSIAAASLLPNGRLLVLPGCGHAPQIERARLVNRVVRDFLIEDDSARGGGS